MNLLYRFLLTFSAISWMFIIYAVKAEWTIGEISPLFFGVSLVAVPIIISAIAIFMSKFFDSDGISVCKECGLADNEFLPVYLGYFFLALSIPNVEMLIAVYVLIFLFTFISQTQYFNPAFLLFGYHYYHILTGAGTRVFVIAKGKVIRNAGDVSFENLKRINDTTFIERN